MKDIEYKILDKLSKGIGNPISIHKIKEKINDTYGHAHYPNIYNAIQEMAKRGLVNIDKYGRSSVTSLNFDNPLLIDSLAQAELINKIHFLEGRKDWQMLVLQINGHLVDMSTIKSILIINPETNARLNRIELLILLRTVKCKKELGHIRKVMGLLQRVHNIRVDCLMLDETNFGNLLRCEDSNPIKEIMADKIAVFYPQNFWFMIKNLLSQGIRIKIEDAPVLLSKISEQDIVFNLARFGYKEMGVSVVQGKLIGIESLVASILINKDNMRRLEAIPIILAKNSKKINYDLLIFLAFKFHVRRQLYNIFKVLDRIKPTREVKQTLNEIKDSIVVQKTETGQKILELSLVDMKRKMRLYDAIE